MLSWIVKHWDVSLTFVLTAVVAVFLHLFFGFIEDAKNAEALETAKLNIITECKSKAQITYGVSNEYQKKLSILSGRYARLKRMYDSAECLPVSGTSSGSDAASTGGELSRHGGIRAEWLIDLGASCEAVRLKAQGLQEFIKKDRGM